MKLTKKEIAIVLKAAEMVEKEEIRFCCSALRHAAKYGRIDGFQTNIVTKFGKFYEKETGISWYSDSIYCSKDNRFKINKDKRVLALLTFAEICGKGIEL